MQNQTVEGPASHCSNCGGSKFLSWERMTDDQQLAAKRLNQIQDLEGGIIFCARCLYQAVRPADRA